MRIAADQLRQRSIPAPPELPYDSTFTAFVEEQLDALLPDRRTVEHYHRLLMNYIDGADPLFITRMVSGQERGKIVATSDHTRLLPSDNAPAWWMHSVMFNGIEVPEEEFSTFVADTPTHFFEVARFPTVSTAGWHVAHILDAKDGNTSWNSWTRLDVARRFIRNIHPLNIFYVPKTDWRRVGGDRDLISFVASIYSARFPAIWSEFCEVAGHPELRPDARAHRIQIEPAPALAKSEAPRTRSRAGRASWDFVLGAATVRPIAAILARHPDVEARTRSLTSELTLERLVALADTLYNKTRKSELEKLAPGDVVEQAIIAWDRIDAGMNKIHSRPSGWTGAIELLREGHEDGLQRIRLLDIGEIATAALRLVDGPYAEANARRRKTD
jgi:hypothetical protein